MAEHDPFDLDQSRKLLEDFFNYKRPRQDFNELPVDQQKWIEIHYIQQWAIEHCGFYPGYSWEQEGYYAVVKTKNPSIPPLEYRKHHFDTPLKAMEFSIHTSFASFLSAAIKSGIAPEEFLKVVFVKNHHS